MLSTVLVQMEGCSSRSSTLRRLDLLSAQFGVSILNPFSLRAFSHRAQYTGSLNLDDHGPFLLSISPDARIVAWLPWTSTLNEDSPAEFRVFLIFGAGSVRAINAGGHFGIDAAVSGNGRKYIFLLSNDAAGTRLRAMSYATPGNVLFDLTYLLAGLAIHDIERLNTSNNGRILVAGTSMKFRVLDTESRNVVFQGEGRFPSLSPSGDALAFVDRSYKLRVRDLRTGRTKTLIGSMAIHGVGAWHPGGGLLLAGHAGPMQGDLIAVDTDSDEYCHLATLSEGDYGSRFAWISNTLLSS